MPWFKRLLGGIVGGCTRSTLNGGGSSSSSSSRGVSMSLRHLVWSSRTPISINTRRTLLAFLPESCGYNLHYRTLVTGASTRNTELPAATLDRRSFWTRGGTDDPDNSNYNEDEAVGSSQRTITLTYRQSFLNNPAVTYPMSVCTAQGLRDYMEDEFFFSQDGEFAAVFDGHGGEAVSRYLRKNLYANVQAFLPSAALDDTGTTDSDNDEETSTTMRRSYSASLEDYQYALTSAISKVDKEVQRISHWSYQGSTAIAVWLHKDRSADNSSQTTTTFVTANVGDSRAVLRRNGTAIDLSKDHKPDDPEERARIEAFGGKVVWCGDVDRNGDPIPEEGIYRVNGNLALSRAVGDRSERPAVVANPDVTVLQMQDGEDDFIIVATDGLWDVFNSVDAVDFVDSMRQDGYELERIPTLMVEEALRRGTYDNITVLIIWLDETAKLEIGQET